MDTTLGMFSLSFRHVLLAGVLALGAGGLLPFSAFGFQPGEAESSPPAANQAQDDQYAVPEGDAAELIDFMRNLRRTRPAAPARKAVTEHWHRQKVLYATCTAADRVLAAESTRQQAQRAAQLKFQALQQLHHLNREPNFDRVNAFLDQLEKDPREYLQRSARQYRLQMKVLDWENLNQEQRNQVLADIKRHFQQTKGLDNQSYELAILVGMALERSRNGAALELYDSLQPIFAACEEEGLVKYSEDLARTARPLRLLGNEMPLEGKLLDGSPLDWNKYRGKVVLVDFWATWCGPCIAELPNVKKNYERYHNRGFEVVGISLDTNKEALALFLAKENIPWPTVIGEDEATSGWKHPMVTRYGIRGIPTAILVDREGKVITLWARGEALGEHLAKLVGPNLALADEQK